MTTRTAEEWGQVAVRLPGWRWMPGMLTQHRERVLMRVSGGRLLMQPDDVEHEGGRVVSTDGPIIVRADDGGPRRPVPDDPATAGCLLAMLGPRVKLSWLGQWCVEVGDVVGFGASIGRACIAAAVAIGRWPGGTP